MSLEQWANRIRDKFSDGPEAVLLAFATRWFVAGTVLGFLAGVSLMIWRPR